VVNRPGHGGTDSGANGNQMAIKEKNVVLEKGLPEMVRYNQNLFDNALKYT